MQENYWLLWTIIFSMFWKSKLFALNDYCYSAIETKQFQMLQRTHLEVRRGAENAKSERTIKIPINCYASRLNEQNKRAYGYCFVIQPIIIMKWLLNYNLLWSLISLGSGRELRHCFPKVLLYLPTSRDTQHRFSLDLLLFFLCLPTTVVLKISCKVLEL